MGKKNGKDIYYLNNKSNFSCIAHIDPKYRRLAAAILEQAVEDLKRAIIWRDYSATKALERWFLSDWGQTLSGNNGQLIIDRIYNEIQKEREKL